MGGEGLFIHCGDGCMMTMNDYDLLTVSYVLLYSNDSNVL